MQEKKSWNTIIKEAQANACLIAAASRMYDYIERLAAAGHGEAQQIIREIIKNAEGK